MDTRFFHAVDKDRFQCDLCPRACVLGPGQRGFCFVREGAADGIVLTTWGRSSGFCIDPIEKKPLNHFHPGSAVLSFGTAGCNLGCTFCQNWDISRAREMDRLQDRALPQDIARAAHDSGCTSVAYTYNEPIVFAEYAIDTALACHAAGVLNVAVTAGYISETAREAFFAPMDAANVDLKGFSEDFYRTFCGARLAPVLDTLAWLVRETGVWVEITTLLIPGANDDPREIDALSRWVHDALGPDVPLHFTAFHPAWRLMNLPPTEARTLLRARDIARRNGLRHVYTGNISDRDTQSTWCPECGARLIERDGYHLGAWNLERDRCVGCGTVVAGRFGEGKGSWGARRQPVRMGR